ncbi:ack-related non-receptor tyrosine kinase-like isoform X2 [Clytia hemisphaerica]|uniref:non-specific protein-tyrosine kinase n=1 Tax=Clytia hemisphaerica TaxID=252671 RepID=A0A7M5VC46_9CNID
MSLSSEQQQLQDFLNKIQLIQFYEIISNKLHITRLEHFEYATESDFTCIGMSMPEIRRLFDSLKKNKKKFFLTKLKKSFRLSSSSNNLQDVSLQDNATQSIQNTNIPSVPEDQKSPRQEAKCLIQEKDIRFLEVIGKGAFGSVRSAEWITVDNEKIFVAVKCIRRTTGNGITDIQNEVVKEASAMSCLNHPNLIRLFGVLISTPMMLVTELAPLGTLLKRLRQERHKFQISILSSFLVQISAGMKYLERNKIVHRDLAARNILLVSYEKIKIGDFGLARPLDDDVEHYVMHPDGLIPFAWCAPECLKYKRFSHASDVWAFGITAYEIFTYGAEPWAGLNGGQILEKIEEPNNERLSCPEHCPREIYSTLYACCWNYREGERSNFQNLEKRLLETLPIEVRAITNSTTGTLTDGLHFIAGDIVTVFNLDSADGIWKGQNRRTGQVGFILSQNVDIHAGIISGAANVGQDEGVRRCSLNRLSVPAEGFVNKLWTSSQWLTETDSTGSELRSTTPKDVSFECTNSFGSGYGGGMSSIEGGYCEDCLSQSSIDSGCLCRCSTYSSDSSTHRCNTADLNAQTSTIGIPQLTKPITIPGRARHRSRGYNITNRGRCSSCSSSNRHSVFSDTLDRDESPSFSSNSPVCLDLVNKTMSSLKLQDSGISNKSKLSTSEGTKSSKTMTERRRSLPDLANPRKRSLLRRSLRFRKKKEELTSKELTVSAPIPNTESSAKFYIPGQDAMIPGGTANSSLESKLQCNLYDLVPIRDHSKTKVLEDLAVVDNRDLESRYDTPPPPKAINSNTHNLLGNGPTNVEDSQIYENVQELKSPSPVAPPRRKKRNSIASKRYSMIELGSDSSKYTDMSSIVNVSPNARQCIILDQKNYDILKSL